MTDLLLTVFGGAIVLCVVVICAGCTTARHHVEAGKRQRQRLAMAREAEADRRYIKARLALDD